MEVSKYLTIVIINPLMAELIFLGQSFYLRMV